MTQSWKVGIVGFGHVGAIIGSVLADRGQRVVGIDVNERTVSAISAGDCPFPEPGLSELIRSGVESGRLEATMDPAALASCDIVLIAVGTPLSDDGSADLRAILAAAESISPHLHDGQLVIVKSTVPPGTTEMTLGPVLCKHADVKLAFSPERLAEGSAIRDLLSIPVIVGGVGEETTRAVSLFWQESLGVETIEVSNPRTAETIKLSGNWWIDLNIAMANEIALLCEQLDIDALEVIEATNTLPKGKGFTNILTPSVGVGGSCLVKDPWIIHEAAKQYGVMLETARVSREINDAMPLWVASLIDDFLQSRHARPEDCKVAILGLAYKNNTGDCRSTPVKPVVQRLVERGYRVEVHDPVVDPVAALQEFGLSPVTESDAVMAGADCVAFLTGHDAFYEIALEKIAELAAPGALVFDGRMYFSREAIETFRGLGLHYKGVGR